MRASRKADESGMTLPTDPYREATNALYRRLNYERVGLPQGSQGLMLGRMRRLMRRLGDPHRRLKFIHVAGTKGKGSTSSMISAGLSAAGYRTGLFCSPHLHCLEERYVIDGQKIDRNDLVRRIQQVEEIARLMDDQRPESEALTFFEITTAVGLIHFAEQNCDAVVLEVGMGGRLDSTNIVRPLVSVITSISLDHTNQLGNTTSAIAKEKAGIIKRGVSTISGVTDPQARREIQAMATLRQIRLWQVETDYQFEEFPPTRPISEPSPSSIHLRTPAQDWGLIRVPFLGHHQAENAALALTVFDAIGQLGLNVSKSQVERGWQGLTMPARVEILGKEPWLVIDGAHNVASAEALADTLKSHFPAMTGKTVLIFGTTREKDISGQLKAIMPQFDHILVTRYEHNPRACPLETTRDAVQGLGRSVDGLFEKPQESLRKAIEMAGPNGLVAITGSLFLAAELREFILNLNCNPETGAN